MFTFAMLPVLYDLSGNCNYDWKTYVQNSIHVHIGISVYSTLEMSGCDDQTSMSLNQL